MGREMYTLHFRTCWRSPFDSQGGVRGGTKLKHLSIAKIFPLNRGMNHGRVTWNLYLPLCWGLTRGHEKHLWILLCMCVPLHVWVCIYTSMCVCVSCMCNMWVIVYVSRYVYRFACIVCVWARLCACVYVDICMFVCTCVYVYVCDKVCVCMCGKGQPDWDAKVSKHWG